MAHAFATAQPSEFMSLSLWMEQSTFFNVLQVDATALYYTLLYYTILYYTILYYTILYYTNYYYYCYYYYCSDCRRKAVYRERAVSDQTD